MDVRKLLSLVMEVNIIKAVDDMKNEIEYNINESILLLNGFN